MQLKIKKKLPSSPFTTLLLKYYPTEIKIPFYYFLPYFEQNTKCCAVELNEYELKYPVISLNFSRFISDMISGAKLSSPFFSSLPFCFVHYPGDFSFILHNWTSVMPIAIPLSFNFMSTQNETRNNPDEKAGWYHSG